MKEKEKVRTSMEETLGIVILVAFTSVIVLISILGQGAYIYYYEPNKFVWITEVVTGIFGVLIGIKRIIKIFLYFFIEEELHFSSSTYF